ncbi:hypothetical protein [Amycolatopsis solani]|uniref:hypothetical protein n=1 Tax=Amycolatopsis solani TaxID=3028615 RepID=UPI0025B1A564|nr:hypothetical protein [Amycolatopsis sp. MEP2-6]
MHENEPPAFSGDSVGSGLARLADLAAPWTAARAVTAPELTRRLLVDEPGFFGLPQAELADAANTLTFLFQHTKVWRLLWAESVAGPALFRDSRTVRSGVGQEVSRELARTVGLELSGKGDVWVVNVSGELSAEWSKLTQSMVRIETETEFKRELEFDVPAGGMDIALWQLESRLTRRLILRPHHHLPPDPLPDWAETAIATAVKSTSILTNVTRSLTRLNGRSVSATAWA